MFPRASLLSRAALRVANTASQNNAFATRPALIQDMVQTNLQRRFFSSNLSETVQKATEVAETAAKVGENVAKVSAATTPNGKCAVNPMHAAVGNGAILNPTESAATSIFSKMLPLFLFNPFVLFSGFYFYSINHTDDENDARGMGHGYIGALRQARRESLSSFKEMACQNEDPKKEYDEATYRRQNYTQLVKTNSFRPGVKERQAKEEACRALAISKGEDPEEAVRKMYRRPSRRVGLYDSEGQRDDTRVSMGLRSHSMKVQSELAESQAERNEERTRM